MSKLKSLMRLRECGVFADVGVIACEIEREIAERYVELPVDADGVTIKLGDTVGRGGVYFGPIDALSISIDGDWEAFHNGNSWVIYGKERHIKPRTLEDVLNDFADEAADVDGRDREEWEPLVARYEREIRELMGGAE